MYFAWNERLDVVWISDPDSRHSRNLAVNSSAAVTIFASDQRWGQSDRGIQLFGRAGRHSGRTAAEAEHTYSARFPYDPAAADAYPVYRFRPREVKLFYERALGAGTLVTARVTGSGLAWRRTDVFA